MGAVDFKTVEGLFLLALFFIALSVKSFLKE